MRARKVIRRIVWVLVIGGCSSYLALLAVVQVGQRVVRYRAERMMGELAVFRVGSTTWSDFQGFQRRWGRWGHYYGECDARHCEYSVRMGDWFGSFLWRSTAFLGDRQEAAINSLVMATRAHLPAVLADITIQDEVVASFRISIWAGVPKGYGPGWRFGGTAPAGYVPFDGGSYTLIASFESGTQFKGYPIPWLELVRPHPTYDVIEPSGCEICIAIHLLAAPGVSVKSLNGLGEFNMKCLTGWSYCTQEADIAPRLWQVYLDDRELRSRLDRCDYKLSQRYQAAENVMLVQLDKDATADMLKGSSSIPSAHFMRAIKGDIPPAVGTPMQLWEEGVGPYPGKREQIGNVLVVMFPGHLLQRTGPLGELTAYQCGIVEGSEGNLREMVGR